MNERNWKAINDATLIQVRSLSLRAKLQALSEQREEPFTTTVKAALEAGIVALTKDDGNGRVAETGFSFAYVPARKKEPADA